MVRIRALFTKFLRCMAYLAPPPKLGLINDLGVLYSCFSLKVFFSWTIYITVSMIMVLILYDNSEHDAHA